MESHDYHCYSSFPGEQVDIFSLFEAVEKQWRDVSQLIIEKGESTFFVNYVLSKVHFCLPFLCRL